MRGGKRTARRGERIHGCEGRASASATFLVMEEKTSPWFLVGELASTGSRGSRMFGRANYPGTSL